jgi:hypothetical protein
MLVLGCGNALPSAYEIGYSYNRWQGCAITKRENMKVGVNAGNTFSQPDLYFRAEIFSGCDLS